MSVIFEPQDETPEGWRRSPLGAVACFFGWHFGQIIVGDPFTAMLTIECARCKTRYARDE